LQKHRKLLFLFFVEYILFLFISLCVSFFDYSISLKLLDFFAEGNKVIHLAWIISLQLSGLTIYGKFTAFVSNGIAPLLTVNFVICRLANYTSGFIDDIPVIIIVLLGSFSNLLYNAYVFNYSNKAYSGAKALFIKNALFKYILISIIYLFSMFLFEELIFNS